MSAPPAFETLRTRLGEIHDLVKVGSLLGVGSADDDAAARRRGFARTSSARSDKVAHEAFVADEIGALLEELRPYEESLDADSFEASLIRVTCSATTRSRSASRPSCPPRSRARARARSPSGSRRARSPTTSCSVRALEQLVELKHRYVDCFPPADELYDTLLDDYERGMKTAEVRAIFDR